MFNREGSQRSIFKIKNTILKKVLGVFDLFAIGYGDLGSSIYYALGMTALYALGATPIALGLAGIVFLCTALTYAEMTSLYHDAGGSASFARRAFNDLISFIAGWGLLLDYIVTIAISAFAIAPYLSYFVPSLSNIPIQIVCSCAIILFLCVLNICGIKQSTRISLILMVLAIVTQLIIIFIGMGFLFNFEYVVGHMEINLPSVDWSPTWSQFWKGTAMAMVAYTGIESIAQLGSEAKTPTRTVPKAIMITAGVLLVIYVGVSLVALSALSPLLLGTTYLENPIAGVVAALPFHTQFLNPWISVLAAIILFVASNAGLIGASRLSYNLGEYYQLPAFLHKLHPRFKTPMNALIVFALCGCAVVIASQGKLEFLGDLYNFGAMIAFFFAHLSVIILRIRQPEKSRPFKIPFNIRFGNAQIPIPAVLGLIVTASVWILIVFTKPEGRVMGFSWIALGLVIYFSFRSKHKIAVTGSLKVERVSVPDFKPLLIKKILVPTRGGDASETLQIACELAKSHKAHLMAIHIIDIPSSLPMNAKMEKKEEIAQKALQKAEAIAREMGVSIEIKEVRARRVLDSLVHEIKLHHIDLVVLGANQKSGGLIGRIRLADALLKKGPCRVWMCASRPK
ncbi:MAG: universal stress protein [Chlamydiae bacterium]|nr:universal stress protein [Chlamydiota bacterium]